MRFGDIRFIIIHKNAQRVFIIAGQVKVTLSKTHRSVHLSKNCRLYLVSFQFVVCDSGDYTVHAIDPDVLVEWDFIEQVVSFLKEYLMKLWNKQAWKLLAPCTYVNEDKENVESVTDFDAFRSAPTTPTG